MNKIQASTPYHLDKSSNYDLSEEEFESHLYELSNQSKVLDQEIPKIMFSITIDLGEKSDMIVVYEEDDPQMISELFGKKHNLTKEEIKMVG